MHAKAVPSRWGRSGVGVVPGLSWAVAGVGGSNVQPSQESRNLVCPRQVEARSGEGGLEAWLKVVAL